MHRLSLLCAALLLFAAAAPARAGDYTQNVTSYLQQMIPMHDGVHLAAIVWRPSDQAKPLPVVLQITPYITDETHTRAVKFARAGYVFVSVDVRGRGDSEGTFRPQFDDGKDGAEVVEWLAKQPWCDGRVTMIGGSYRGMMQWRVLAQHPKHLAAIVPTAPPYPGYDEPNTKGIYSSYMVQWLASVSGRFQHEQLFNDSDYWESQFVRNYKAGGSYASMGVLAGANQPVLDEWLQHHAYDAYWAAYNPDPREYAQANIPILTITGYFDGDQPGTFRYYREFMAQAPAAERARFYLLVGPWDHGGTRYPQKQLGGITFPDDSVLDIDQLQIDWFNWVLKGGKRPQAVSDRVNYYVMADGSGEWRHAPALEAMTGHVQRLYLSSVDGPANDAAHAGRLMESLPQDREPDQFVSDPRERDTPAAGDNFLTDPSAAYGKHVLVYVGAPLQQPVEVAGFMRLVANISLDTPDADLAAEVQAIYPDGRTVILGDDFVRARFRRGLDKEIPVTPGAVEPYVFDGFYLTDRRLPAGSRIRLVLSPLDSPDYERNDNTGGPLGVKGMDGGRVATVSVYLDAAHPSYLELPIAKD